MANAQGRDQKLASEISQLELTGEKNKFLTFYLGDEDYGIDIRFVTEIIGIQRITQVPRMPSYVKGVINLRGNVIPVIDVRIRFEMVARDYDDRTCIVVVNIHKKAVGLVVDSVNEVVDIHEGEIQPAPNINQAQGSRFIQGLGKINGEVKILLDVHKIFQDDELDDLEVDEGAEAVGAE